MDPLWSVNVEVRLQTPAPGPAPLMRPACRPGGVLKPAKVGDDFDVQPPVWDTADRIEIPDRSVRIQFRRIILHATALLARFFY